MTLLFTVALVVGFVLGRALAPAGVVTIHVRQLREPPIIAAWLEERRWIPCAGCSAVVDRDEGFEGHCEVTATDEVVFRCVACRDP